MAKMFFPQYARGREGIDLALGGTVLEHIRRIGGVEIDSECGGKGTCGKDIIRVTRGAQHLSRFTDIERRLQRKGGLAPGQRLACQAKVVEDNGFIEVFIRDFGRYTILTDVVDTPVDLEPAIVRKGDRILHYTGEDLGPYKGRILGLAIDVGTTTLAMQAVDLETGQDVGGPIASKNPQIAYGNDVISRIGYARDNTHGLRELQGVVVGGVNASLDALERRLGAPEGSISGSIYDVVIVGNSTMRSLFFHQNVHDLGVIPFEPSSKSPLTRKAVGLGLRIHPEGLAYGAPLIGGHAGADCLADIIATGIYERPEISLVIDIGTNGEVVVGNRDRILTASCAAGGAYEGYQIRCGVAAIEGAITKVALNGSVSYETLGGKAPVGICGSGVIDLLAELLRTGTMSDKARINKDYHLTDNISISQTDINHLITAKAGLRVDQDLLLSYYGADASRVTRVYLAGAFGNYMNVDNAIAIGLLPDIPRDRFVKFGNGALAGAKAILLSLRKRHDAERVAPTIEHHKPNEEEGEDFMYEVAERMYFT